MYSIDSRLKNDSHEMITWQDLHFRLHKNASMPWIIIIPESETKEFHDLPSKTQLNITAASQVISQFFQKHLNIEKINFAAIGNVVSQLHIHVVGRHSQDPLWPDVVWGRSLPDVEYAENQKQLITEAIQSGLIGIES